jgi:hypothetical protein
MEKLPTQVTYLGGLQWGRESKKQEWVKKPERNCVKPN